MKIIGKRSLVYWLRFPFLIYVIGFTLSGLWIVSLMIYFLLTGKFGSVINNHRYNFDGQIQNVVQFKYPFSKMVLATENSTQGLLFALVGIISVIFILIYAYKIVNQLSKEIIFSKTIVGDFKILSFGIIFFGIIILLIDLTIESNKFDFTPPFFYILIGFLLLFIKEIFEEGKDLQEQNDLTI